MAGNWFVTAQPRPNATRRLFVFHHAGGSASAYSRWNALVPEDTELVLLELPGRALRHREPFYTNLDTLIEAIGKAIESKLDRPYVLMGHSMGALIALQLTRWIEKHRLRSPSALVASAFDAPTDDRISAHGKVGDEPDQQLIDSLKVYGGLPKEVTENPTYLKFFLSIIRADIRILESYEKKGEAKVAVPILTLLGDSDQSASLGGAQKWAKLTKSSSSTKVFSGDHFFILQRSDEVVRYVFEALDSL